MNYPNNTWWPTWLSKIRFSCAWDVLSFYTYQRSGLKKENFKSPYICHYHEYWIPKYFQERYNCLIIQTNFSKNVAIPFGCNVKRQYWCKTDDIFWSLNKFLEIFMCKIYDAIFKTVIDLCQYFNIETS